MFHIHTPEPTTIDYATIAAVRNAVWRDDPITVEQMRHFDESWPSAYLSQRVLVELDGVIVAVGHYFENHWQYQPGKVDMALRRRSRCAPFASLNVWVRRPLAPATKRTTPCISLIYSLALPPCPPP